MRIRTVLTAAVLATFAALPLAGVASAQPAPTSRDCRDFASQAAAQSALRSHSGDPARLDPDHNGVACEDYFRPAGPAPSGPRPVRPVIDRPQGDPAVVPLADDAADAPVADPAAAAPVRTIPEHQILVKPRGAADTGDGSVTPFHRVPVTMLAEGLGAVVALGTGWRLIRRSR